MRILVLNLLLIKNMKLLVVIFVFMACLSCGNKNVGNGKVVEKRVSVNNEQESVLKPQPEEYVERVMKPVYDISSYVFDDLSPNLRTEFISQHKDDLNGTIFSYYDRYSMINEIDSIFSVLESCDFSINANRTLLPFYVHVLFEVLKNKNVDGYLGEAVVDDCFLLFNNYPGIFYQHVNLINEAVRESLITNVAIGFYYEDFDKNKLDSIFERHKIMLPNMEKQISATKKNIEIYYQNI